ncbi:Glycosyl transferase, family 14-containing protein [Strongyloides ratti]|uniref:Glycosyl transferase, family 14-containing protein n=1 Tax=Strongyloides ratti TaxID=34506 RepID=A0A090LL92_STRRB|nr:Glycosyl transferase, family 14-containing protein [Strongyloides ratti]CEF70485.1 Glycosyl transferase, family 14-containing protein [Strongyloides ratti]
MNNSKSILEKFDDILYVKTCKQYEDIEKRMSRKYVEDIKEIRNVIEKPFDINLDCKKLINGDMDYINKVKNNRIIYENKNLSMDCSSIYSRGFNINESLSEIEKKYSLAFAFNIYKNYEVIELKLLSIYSPNNHYCYMIDLKNPKLYDEMIQLEKCLPNVYVPRVQYDMKSNGENGSLSHYECMKRLVKTKFDYIFLLQNDEMPIKTNRELIEILETMNFAMDMRIAIDDEVIDSRVDKTKSWTYKDLNIFLDDDIRKTNLSIMEQKIEFTNGLVSTGLPKEAVEYLVNKLNITTFLNQLNTNLYGNDELTWQTLLTNEILNVPGYIPKKYALNYFLRPYYLSRLVLWGGEPCLTNTFHHSICLWGVESLTDLKNRNHFFLYRFKEEFDFGALKCYAEYLYNKTHFEKYKRPDLWFYYNSPLSIYKRLSLKNDINLIKNYKQWL